MTAEECQGERRSYEVGFLKDLRASIWSTDRKGHDEFQLRRQQSAFAPVSALLEAELELAWLPSAPERVRMAGLLVMEDKAHEFRKAFDVVLEEHIIPYASDAEEDLPAQSEMRNPRPELLVMERGGGRNDRHIVTPCRILLSIKGLE